MANLIANASSTFTGAATWAAVATGAGAALPTVTTNVTNTTTAYVYNPAFTITNTEVLDGVLIHLARANSSTGTFSVALSDDNGTTATREVTVNVTDLFAVSSGAALNYGWYFFKFGTTLTADGGADYRIGVKSSTASTVSVTRASATAADWSHLIRTTTAATAAAADAIYLCGEFVSAGVITTLTVTMNQTVATDYGTLDIGASGVLTWGTTAATNYILQLSGNLNVWAGGIYNQGTVATPVPRDGTATLQFDCVADGDFGLIANGGSTLVLQGLSRTIAKLVTKCLLNADAAANATSLGVSADTGWLSGDRIAVASTSRTATDCEAGTLNGAAGAATLTVNGFAGTGGGLLVAHSGTSPTQAEVALLTRNVVVRSVSTTAMAYVSLLADGDFDADWVEFRYFGTNVVSKRGVELATTTGTVTMHYCAINDCETWGLNLTGTTLTGSIAVDNLVMYNCGSAAGFGALAVSAATGIPALSDVLIIRTASTATAVSLSDLGMSLSGLTVVGATGTGIAASEAGGTGSWSNIVVHSGAGTGFSYTSGVLAITTSAAFWRNNGSGLAPSGSTGELTITNLVTFGNTANNISISAGAYMELYSPILNGDTTFSTGTGINIVGSASKTIIHDGDFSTVTGIKTAHTNDISVNTTNPYVSFVLDNCKLGAATEVSAQTLLSQHALIASQNHDQTAGNHRYWKRYGNGQTDSTIFNVSSPSERLTPNDASFKLESGPRVVACNSGATVTVTVYVRRSVVGDGTAYTGAQPRLVVRRNSSIGYSANTVLDTAIVAAGTWEQLSGTTTAATSDGAFEFFVDADGTAGWVNVDDWATTS